MMNDFISILKNSNYIPVLALSVVPAPLSLVLAPYHVSIYLKYLKQITPLINHP